MEDALGGQAYILKAKKFAEPLFQSKKFAEKVRESRRHFWAILGNFGPFWVIFGPFWIILGHSRPQGHFASFLAFFGPFCGIFGQICGKFKFFCGIVGVRILAFRMYALLGLVVGRIDLRGLSSGLDRPLLGLLVV